MTDLLNIAPKSLVDIAGLTAEDLRLQNSKIDTASGQIEFTKGTLTYYSISDALARLHDLHLRALGDEPKIPLSENLPQKDAQALYRTALACQIESCLSMSSEDNLLFLHLVADTAITLHSTGGMDSIFYTSLLSAKDGQEDGCASALRKWESATQDPRPGGGHKNTYARDKEAEEIFLHKPIITSQMDLLAKNSVSGLKAAMKSRMDSISYTSHKDCVDTIALGTSVAFGALGAAAGAELGPPGVMAGAAAGVAIGDKLGERAGNLYCPQDSPAAKASDKDKDDDNSGTPKKPDDEESRSNGTGCFPQFWDFTRNDPYSNFAHNTRETFIPYGSGLRSLMQGVNGRLKISSVTTLVSIVQKDLSIRAIGKDVRKGGRFGGGNFSSNLSFTQQSEFNPKDLLAGTGQVSKGQQGESLDYRVVVEFQGSGPSDDSGNGKFPSTDTPTSSQDIAVEFLPGSNYYKLYGPRLEGKAAIWFLNLPPYMKEAINRMTQVVDHPKYADIVRTNQR
jgi:hypothetical protein